MSTYDKKVDWAFLYGTGMVRRSSIMFLIQILS